MTRKTDGYRQSNAAIIVRAMKADPEQLAQHRVMNAVQMLLVTAGLMAVLAIPAWVLAGGAGVVWTVLLGLVTAWLSGNVPSRVVLAQAGASPLARHQAPGLYAMVDRIYRAAGLTIEPALFFVPSDGLNAFAVGTSSDGGIAITDGLVRRLDARQLAGVLAHEVSHLRHNDTRVMSMAAAMTQMTVFGATLVQFLLLLAVPWMLASGSPLPWLLLFMVALTPTASTLLQLALSRNREFTADLEATALTGDPGGLASALDVLERDNSTWLRNIFGREPVKVPWLQTHPPTEERIRRLAQLARQPEAGRGEWTQEHPLIVDRPPARVRWYRPGPWR